MQTGPETMDNEYRLRRLGGMRVGQWPIVIHLPELIEHGMIGAGIQNDLDQGGLLTLQSFPFPTCVCLKKYVKANFAFWKPQLNQIFES